MLLLPVLQWHEHDKRRPVRKVCDRLRLLVHQGYNVRRSVLLEIRLHVQRRLRID
jgi:hypothetical protein